MAKITIEEKVAKSMVTLLSDLRLDLDLLGMYLSKMATKTFFLRAERVFQASEEALTMDTQRDHYERIKRLGER